jgi:hypothetical protein
VKMKTTQTLAAVAVLVSALPLPSWAADITITVGPGGQHQRLDQAVARANSDPDPANYYVLNLAPKVYVNDFAEVSRPMTIQGDPAQAPNRATLKATIPLPNQKGIIFTTSSLHIARLVLTGAQIDEGSGGNGAGIRDQNLENTPASLVVEDSVFHDNQAGILQGDDILETVTITDSVFRNNGGGHPHAVYIDEAASLTVTGSLFCGQLVGHNIKSRAQMTTIVHNRLFDGAAAPANPACRVGSTSFAIDIANGGVAVIRNNHITQDNASGNETMVIYGEERLVYPTNSLRVAHNTFVNTKTSGGATGVWDYSCTPMVVVNNTFTGLPFPIYPPTGCDVKNSGNEDLE